MKVEKGVPGLDALNCLIFTSNSLLSVSRIIYQHETIGVPMRIREYEIIGYFVLFIYSLVVLSKTLSFYQIASPNWHILDWIVVLLVSTLMPGLPGLMLIIPSKFLNSAISLFCQIIGLVGIITSLVWGLLVTPQWWLVALLAILLNWIVHRIQKQNQVVI